MTNLQPQLFLKPGEVVFEEGQKGDCMYVVTEGEIEIFRDSSNGRVELARLGPGDFFGEMAIVQATKRTATAIALCESKLIKVQADELEELINTRPDFGTRMIRTLVQRLWDTTDNLVGEREKLGIVLATEQLTSKKAPEKRARFKLRR